MQTEIVDGAAQHRRGSRAALVLLLLFALTMWSPMASNAQSPVPEPATVPTDVEAWYYVADDTIAPAPPPVVPDPVNPYGEDTLHVSITGGNEDARTYLTLDVTRLPTTFDLVEGILKLPIDPGGVTINAETARVQVCLSEIPPKSDEGSFEEPPEVNCKTKTPATYEEKPFPHLVADITEFGTDLSFSGLAILPSNRAKEKSDTWHVTFYGKKNETEDSRSITAQLTFTEPAPLFDFDDTDDADTSVPDFSSGGSEDFDFDTSTGPSFEAGDVPGNEAVEEPVAIATPVQADEEEGFELAAEEALPSYTIVWALPLLLLAFATYFSSALTREIVLRRDSSSS